MTTLRTAPLTDRVLMGAVALVALSAVAHLARGPASVPHPDRATPSGHPTVTALTVRGTLDTVPYREWLVGTDVPTAVPLAVTRCPTNPDWVRVTVDYGDGAPIVWPCAGTAPR